ncbi:MAG TPA: MBL fold metallo-hydrolase, partial [Candidatus Binatus sp.]|nr:MBL fold metallo-hydrolase [Candidatus Binatus sp.]
MLERVNEEVTRIPGKMANTYLVEAPKGLILVDTGLPGTERRITKALQQLGKTSESVKLILITHRHLDHIGSVSAIKHMFPKAVITSHPFEKPYIAGTLVANVPPAWTLPGRMMRRLTGFGMWLMKFLRLLKYKPIYVDKPADDESILESTGLDGSILWTPGHTKGSITLFLNKTKTAIVGDLLRN